MAFEMIARILMVTRAVTLAVIAVGIPVWEYYEFIPKTMEFFRQGDRIGMTIGVINIISWSLVAAILASRVVEKLQKPNKNKVT